MAQKTKSAAPSERSNGWEMTNVPIAPELLRYVDDYIDETDLGMALDDELDSTSNLVVFCRELFAQLFANVIGERITGIGATSAQRANILRRKHGGSWPEPLRRLVGHFQHLSRVYDDLLGVAYSGGSEARSDFHFDFIPSVLSDLEAWARERGDDELAVAVAATRTRYARYLMTWEPDRA